MGLHQFYIVGSANVLSLPALLTSSAPLHRLARALEHVQTVQLWSAASCVGTVCPFGCEPPLFGWDPCEPGSNITIIQFNPPALQFDRSV